PITGTRINCLDGEAAQFACQRVDLVSFLPVSAIGGGRGVMVNDIWGWTDPETGKEYALVGRMDGTSFVDVTDPANPVYIGNLPKTEGSPGAVWRDIKVYQNHAFIVADASGAHGMQVFDLTQLRDFDGTPKTFAPVTTYDRIHSAHNIVINEESGFAYTVGNSSGGETCGGGLHMIDIRDPKNPTFAGCFADAETGRAGTGYTHDAQCVIYRGPDADHQGKEICFGANETALSIADVTDKANPVALSRAAYPNVAYTHQGWLTEDHRYFFVNDELDEIGGNVTNTRTLIWDVSDLDDPQLVKEYLLSTQASDHNLYIRGNLMYQSNYLTGLRVLDVTDPANPVEVGYFDTVPYGSDGPGFGGSWSNYPFFPSGTIAVTSMSEGLFLLKKNDVDI
ncbi:MAG: choice-of-anchor B family protein, partial [Bacteroidetes bacterium]